MIYPLTIPIPANLHYDSLRIENIQYDGTQYTAEVFGMVNGEPMPLIYRSISGVLHRVSQYTITDLEINEVLASHPEILSTERIKAAMLLAVQRLQEAAAS